MRFLTLTSLVFLLSGLSGAQEPTPDTRPGRFGEKRPSPTYPFHYTKAPPRATPSPKTTGNANYEYNWGPYGIYNPQSPYYKAPKGQKPATPVKKKSDQLPSYESGGGVQSVP